MFVNHIPIILGCNSVIGKTLGATFSDPLIIDGNNPSLQQSSLYNNTVLLEYSLIKVYIKRELTKTGVGILCETYCFAKPA
jgi:hypothetical protein